MSRIGHISRLSRMGLVIALVAILQPNTLLACAACYGKSDSPMAWGMNAGIFTLLVVITGVLAGISGFFVYIARRAAKMSDNDMNNSNQH